ncbi:unnamed protein product [Caenorhabditis auriculariae]|uniref:Uncharacterized protein n=1 Tax=Caenorhabditis auriculariae TaxID=2777116 RepID=A0A8S1HX90_9PELO|nr:unnamed protein product [Caenorhabditis auriculariae]
MCSRFHQHFLVSELRFVQPAYQIFILLSMFLVFIERQIEAQCLLAAEIEVIVGREGRDVTVNVSCLYICSASVDMRLTSMSVRRPEAATSRSTRPEIEVIMSVRRARKMCVHRPLQPDADIQKRRAQFAQILFCI